MQVRTSLRLLQDSEPVGATKEDVELFKKYIGPKVKIKAAGGVSSMEDLEMFLELGCDRIGTSRAVGLCKGELTEGY